MNKNYKPDADKKGKQFEDFVEYSIFPASDYELLHKTVNNKQNVERYVKSSLKPDFQFQCRVTGKRFYVEAKFRSKTFKDKYDVLSEQQFHNFPHLDTCESPIFIMFGYGGEAGGPDFLSLIPLSAIKSKSLSPEEVLEYRIEKEMHPSHKFLKQENKIEQENQKEDEEDFQAEKQKQKIFSENQGPKKSSKRKISFYTWAGVGLAAILVVTFAFSFSADASGTNLTSEEKFKEIVSNYYRSMDSNQIEKLPDFLSPKVNHWFGDDSPSQEQIMLNAESHRGRYPFSASEIDWETLKVIEKEEGDFWVSYKMIYKSKQKITDDYTVYELKLITEWDENFKLKSIREIRL